MAIELTADQLGTLSAILRVTGSRLAPSERRRTRRLDVRSTVSVSMVQDGEGGPAISLRVRDLSPRGIAFLHTQPMDVGQQLVLTMQRADGPPVQILCTVMHSRAGKGRLHTIGAEFTCALGGLPEPMLPPSAGREAERDRIQQWMLD